MKIIFLYPKWTSDYGSISHFAKKTAIYPPLNLAYLAAIAEKQGYQAKIIDGEVENISCNQMIEETIKFNPDLIGMTACTPFFHFVEEIAINLKKKIPEVPIILGGPHITVLREEAFKDFFNYGFIGEADISFSKFLESYRKKQDISEIPGILYRKEKEIKYSGDVSLIEDMDSLLTPAFHLLKMDKYKMGTLEGIKNFAPIMSIRGCPFKCIFCSTKMFGRNLRKRSPELILKDIKYLKEKFNINHFIFLDDTLTLDRNHIINICKLIIKENLNITFEGTTRANLIDEEITSIMKKAGLIRLSFGLESVDKEIRKTIRKEVPLESYIIANKLTNKYKIETLNSCMIGLPGETKNTIKKTLSFLRDSHEIKQANISIAVPYPGTELYEMAKNERNDLKLITSDFSKFRRYNCATMKVGELTPEDLIKLQNDAFASIYLPYWRWKPVIRKSGVYGLFLTFKRLFKSISYGHGELIFINKNYWKK